MRRHHLSIESLSIIHGLNPNLGSEKVCIPFPTTPVLSAIQY
jgi:hypothetical protein